MMMPESAESGITRERVAVIGQFFVELAVSRKDLKTGDLIDLGRNDNGTTTTTTTHKRSKGKEEDDDDEKDDDDLLSDNDEQRETKQRRTRARKYLERLKSLVVVTFVQYVNASQDGAIARVRAYLPKLFFEAKTRLASDDDDDDDDDEAERTMQREIKGNKEAIRFVFMHAWESSTRTTRKNRLLLRKNNRNDSDSDGDNADADDCGGKRLNRVCGVLSCSMHERDDKGTLKSQLEKLRPERQKDSKLPTIERDDQRFPCPGDLPALALENIIRNVDSRTYAKLQQVSRGFRACMDMQSPGLALTLHPHQRAALAWMRMRERRNSLEPVIEPGYVELFAKRVVASATKRNSENYCSDDDDEDVNDDDLMPFYLNASTGAISRKPPRFYNDSCGGALCDEPGLGKTVTVCALILATIGSKPPPPKGTIAKVEESSAATITTDTDTTFNKAGYSYYIDEPAFEENSSLSGDDDVDIHHRVDNQNKTPNQKTITPTTNLRRSRRSGAGTPLGLYANLEKKGMLVGTLPTLGSYTKDNKFGRGKNYDELYFKEDVSEWSSPPGYYFQNKKVKLDDDDRESFRRNTRFFIQAFKLSYARSGKVVTQDVIEFILQNTGEISQFKQLVIPPYRRNDDQPLVLDAFNMIRVASSKSQSGYGFGPPTLIPNSNNNSNIEEGDYLVLDKRALHQAWLEIEREDSGFKVPLLQKLDNPTIVGGKKIYLSKATLIIVPQALISHWLEQIAFCRGVRTVDEGAPKIIVVEKREHSSQQKRVERQNHYGLGGYVKNLSSIIELQRISDLSKGYLEELLEADIVIVALSSLSGEFGKKDSALHQIHFNRIVLDEGHQIGASLALSNRLNVMTSLLSHSKWLMTGTPTPATFRGATVAHLQPLLGFLKQDPFGSNARLFSSLISKPLEQSKNKIKKKDESTTALYARAEAARVLLELLQRIMVRTCKTHIRLPSVRKITHSVPFTKQHALSYNRMVSHVQRSMLLADWFDPNHEQSLLRANNAQEARQTVINLREAACVIGDMPLTYSNDEIDEAERDLRVHLAEKLCIKDLARQQVMINRVLPAMTRFEFPCDCCGILAYLPLVTPCAHVLCVECVQNESSNPGADITNGDVVTANNRRKIETLPSGVRRAPRSCAKCGCPYKMQDATPREDNPMPCQPVPQDLIELQCSYIQRGWTVNFNDERSSHESSKAEFLLERLRSLNIAVTKVELENFEANERFFKDQLVRENNNPNNGGGQVNNINAQAPSLPAAKYEAPVRKRDVDFSFSVKKLPKVVVFSSFKTHLHVVDVCLTEARVPFQSLSRQGYSRTEKDAALTQFRDDPDCPLLLLDRSAAEGLDLSFVSRVFLMEPLENESLEEQVISRAHRMGQKGIVYVEVLVARGTAEETLLEARAEFLKWENKKKTTTTRNKENDEGEEEENVVVVLENSIMEEVNRSGRRVLEKLSLADIDESAFPKSHEEDFFSLKKKAAVEIAADVTVEKDDDDDDDAWRILVKSALGTTHEVKLKNKDATTIAELRKLCVDAANISEDERPIVECGIPMRSCENLPKTCAIGLLGVRDRDIVNVITASSVIIAAASKKTTTTAADDEDPETVAANNGNDNYIQRQHQQQQPNSTKRKKNPDVRDDVADAKLRRKLNGILPDSEIATSRMLDDPDGGNNNNGDDFLSRQREGMAQSAAVLLRATQGGASSDLRDELSKAVDERMIETEGRQKVAAALNNQYTISPLPNDISKRLRATYTIARELALRHQKSQRELTDVFSEIPKPFLVALLKIVAANEQDRKNLHPESMACASPRTFWNIVRLAQIGLKSFSFAEALEEIAPGVCDWRKICSRERSKPCKYVDYVQQ